MSEENEELNNRVHNQEQLIEKGHNYKAGLLAHLNELVKSNSQLLQALEECCSEDINVHKILNEKANRLQVSCSNVKNSGLRGEIKEAKKAGILREISNSSLNKVAEKSGKSWINDLKDIENMRTGY